MGEITTFSHQPRPSLSDQVAPEGSFSDQVARLLDRIEYRRADSAAQREAIFRLRYQAYMRDGTIAPSAEEMFSDPYDERGNVYLFGLYLDGVLASSLRLHVGSADRPGLSLARGLSRFPAALTRRRQGDRRSDPFRR
jgi:hypothetical protein